MARIYGPMEIREGLVTLNGVVYQQREAVAVALINLRTALQIGIGQRIVQPEVRAGLDMQKELFHWVAEQLLGKDTEVLDYEEKC